MSLNVKPELDPYRKEAENHDITPQKKIDGLKHLIKEAKTAMLTTRASTGQLHSRAMTPCEPVPGEHGLHFMFIANNASPKFDEIHNDAHVNVSFYDKSNTDWASVSGTAKVIQDKDVIKAHWSHMIAGYFGDLKDGVHKGDWADPRVSIIEVIPDEIRYWVSTSGAISRSVGAAVGAVTGHLNVPGELRTITTQEIQLIEGLHTKPS